jgi:hypothetical protein
MTTLRRDRCNSCRVSCARDAQAAFRRRNEVNRIFPRWAQFGAIKETFTVANKPNLYAVI